MNTEGRIAAVKYIEELQSTGFQMDTIMHNIYLDALSPSENEKLWKHVALLEDLPGFYFTPDGMRGIIRSCLYHRDYHAVMEWLYFGLNRNKDPDGKLYLAVDASMLQSVLHAFYNSQVLQYIEQLWVLLKTLPPDTFNIVLIAPLSPKYTQQEPWRKFWWAFVQSKSEHALDLFLWTSAKYFQEVKQAPRQMVLSMEEILAYNGKYEQLLKLHQWILQQIPWSPPRRVITEMVKYFHSRQQWANLITIAQLSRIGNWRMDRQTFELLLQSMRFLNQVDEVQHILKKMEELGLLSEAEYVLYQQQQKKQQDVDEEDDAM